MQILDNISSKPTSSLKSDDFLVIDQVSKVYDTPKGKYIVLEDVNLRVKEGEFICIIGHSGCGKSTLLNMVAGFNQPTTGVISVQGQLITEPGPERMVVFQNYSLLPWLTAKENIHLGVESVYPDKSTAEQLEIVKENLELVGLSEAANKKPSQLSGGMKQRVSIARALATRPQILILDEPFGALDPITREELQEELLNIWQDHRITVLMITHDIDEALFLADRLVMMTNGPAAQIGEILDIPFSRPRNRAKIMEDPRYYELRNYALDFLFRRFAHHEEDEETTEEITTEDKTPDTGLAQSTTIAPSSSHIATEVLNMQPNRPNPDENPYAKTPEPELTRGVDPVIPDKNPYAKTPEPEFTHGVDPATPPEEMSPATKTAILFSLWGVIIATLVGSLVFNSTPTTANKEAETPEPSATTMETETTPVAETVTPITTASPTLSPTPTATLSPTTVPSVSPSPSLESTATPSPNAVATTSPSPNSLGSTTTLPSPSSTTAIAPTTTLSPSPTTISPSPVATASPTPESLAATTTSPSATATAPTTTASPSVSSSPVATTSPTESATSISSTTATPSAEDLEQLNQEVFATINQAWTNTPVTAVSVYLIKVSRTGDILSYEAKSPDATQNVNNTPLPKLVKSDVTQTPYTQFEATFTPVGTLDLKSAQ
ncbi:Bicarbonate transport ATP-binding protein CmpD [Planktothrix tepida]|uniref:Nitrate ABC transporter, ATPase subunits C and D n=1 Tax=Planktothrix tepida PCC 9214 TaxID=671072 RepID=A0A1J1LF30_9CYAN|nr:nitrate ABC transporter ATP-binding protein [Planktothrix tepida]CAD5924789.1 Bicarbonate transport ATP-binding protein CmpD [Planktothrix tepida]CUR31187.1 Nitrate ABC transporter, ATPase subunits C and D [Planktothrix tepida PCC 9214]